MGIWPCSPVSGRSLGPHRAGDAARASPAPSIRSNANPTQVPARRFTGRTLLLRLEAALVRGREPGLDLARVVGRTGEDRVAALLELLLELVRPRRRALGLEPARRRVALVLLAEAARLE